MKSRRLGRLVRLKKLVEQVHAVELDQRRRSLNEAEDELDETLTRLDALGDRLVDPTAEELVRASHFEEHLSAQAELQRGTIVEREDHVSEGVGRVKAAWQDRRLLQHMEEMAREREAFEHQVRTWKGQDDNALASHSRSRTHEEDTP